MAVIACVLWVAGFEVLPWLHVATHELVGKHHHDATGAIIRDDVEGDWRHHADDDHDHVVDDDDHDDDDHDNDDHDDDDHDHAGHHHDDHHVRDAAVDSHEHGASAARPGEHHHRHRSAGEQDRSITDALTHGRHSLAHHDVAITAPPPAITKPVPCNRRLTFATVTTVIEPFSFSPGRAVARGPPAASIDNVS